MTVIQKFTDEYYLSLLDEGSRIQGLYNNELSLYECISLAIQASQHGVLEDSSAYLATISTK